MPETFIYMVQPDEAQSRIDKLLVEQCPDLTRSAVQRVMEEGGVEVGGKQVTKNYKVRAGDQIVLRIPEPKPLELVPEEIPLDIRYEDRDLLIVNKPKGMVVHPAAGNDTGTLVHALLHHCGDSLSGINGTIRPGIVHRIDKDTSGLLVVAKNDFAHQSLARQIKEHTFTRRYESIVYGVLKEGGTVNVPIGRHPVHRKKMAVTNQHARHAVTHYDIIEQLKGFTHIGVTLETGRTHQIRVHMAHIGHPVAGDPVYGPKKVITSLGGQALHARALGFRHPRDGRYIEVESELPAYMTAFINQFKQ